MIYIAVASNSSRDIFSHLSSRRWRRRLGHQAHLPLFHQLRQHYGRICSMITAGRLEPTVDKFPPLLSSHHKTKLVHQPGSFYMTHTRVSRNFQSAQTLSFPR